jgi:hypothetical protein
MRGPAKLATYIGIAMVLGGFALIGLAWNGSAAEDRLAAQFPFLLSGGIAGLGLIGAGAGVLFVQALREIDAEESVQLEQVTAGLRRTAAALAGGSAAPAPALAAAPAAVATPAPPSEQAAPSPDEAWAPPQEEAAGDEAGDVEALVVVGRSSFHDPGCHLVSSRDDLDLMRREEAEHAGLKGCRICKP